MTRRKRAAIRGASFVALLALVSAGAWAGWGIFGWVAVMLAAAAWLIWKAATASRPQARREETRRPLVAVTGFIDPFEAELACQTLEAEGIRALYVGGADSTGAIAGGRITYAAWRGKTRVAVHDQDAQRAVEVLAALRERAPGEPTARREETHSVAPMRSDAIVPARRSAAQAFGESPSGLLARFARRRRGTSTGS